MGSVDKARNRDEVVSGMLMLAAVVLAIMWSVDVLMLPHWSATRWGMAQTTVAIVVAALGIFLAVVVATIARDKMLVVTTLALTAGCVAAVVFRTNWLQVGAVALVFVWAVICAFVADRWSRWGMRIVLIIAVAFALLFTLKVGRAEIVTRRAGAAQATATSLDRKRADATIAVNDTAGVETKAAGALNTAAEAVGALVGDDSTSTAPLPSGCATAKAPAAELCAFVGELADLPPKATPEIVGGIERRVTESRAGHDTKQDLDTTTRDALAAVSSAASARVALASAVAVGDGGAHADDLRNLEDSINALCTAADGQIPGPTRDAARTCDPRSPAGRVRLRGLALKEAEAQRAGAVLTLAMTGSPDAKTALEAADAALVTAQSTTENSIPSTTIVDVLGVGASTLTRALPGLGDRNVPIGLEVVGWTLLLALAITAYRQLEIISAKRGLALVKIDDLAGTRPDDSDLQAAFRRHVIANVPEPGSVPGGSAAAPTNDILEAADPTSKLIGALLKVIKAVAAASPGYRVDAVYQAPVPSTEATAVGPAATTPADGSTSHELFVRVIDARTGRTVAQNTVHEDSARLAIRSGGYWAAAWILSQDRTAPKWAAWSADSAKALAAYDETGDDTAPIDKLAAAVRLAPTSGLVLSRLADAYELHGQPLDALELHLRAVICHPRYATALYRLAMSLGLLEAQSATWWTNLEIGQQRTIHGSLRRCVDVLAAEGVRGLAGAHDALDQLDPDPHPGKAPPSATPSEAFSVLAEFFRAACQQLFTIPRVVLNAFRKSERRYWWPLLPSQSGSRLRRRAHKTVDVARYGIVARQTYAPPPGLDDAVADLDRSNSWWQVVYNLACCQGILATTNPAYRSKATALLEQILEKDGAEALTRVWVDQDADLDALRTDERFHRFRDRLADGPQLQTGGRDV